MACRLCDQVTAVRMTEMCVSEAENILQRKQGERRDSGSMACQAGLQMWIFSVSLDGFPCCQDSRPQERPSSALFPLSHKDTMYIYLSHGQTWVVLPKHN